MKLRSMIPILLFIMPIILGGCKVQHQAGAELVSVNLLKIRKGFSLYEAMTKENGRVIIIEKRSPNSRLKAKEVATAWQCSCGKSTDVGACNIKTSEGSDTAECRGNCFCGFTKVPVPSKIQLTSKKLLGTIGDDGF